MGGFDSNPLLGLLTSCVHHIIELINMLATQASTDHFNPAPHEHRTHLATNMTATTETLVEADHVAPKLNEDDSFVQDLLRDGVSCEIDPSRRSLHW